MYSCVIIGTGFSGIAMGIKLKEKGIQDFIILEKANEVGGTWRENTYPGAACDIPSVLYSFSFEPYPDWDFKWSGQAQILGYIKYVIEQYDLSRHIQFQQEITGAIWKASEGYWSIKTKKGDTFQSKMLISAIGQLHHPSIPNFKGKDLFEGASWHSARWKHAIDLTNKTIGVIGNAASAVQFIPEIAKIADKVLIFQRSPNWMLPKQDRAYGAWEKKLVKRFPLLLKVYRNSLWLQAGLLYLLMKAKGVGWLRKLFQGYSIRTIKKHIKDPALVKKLIPNYPFGGKRVLFSDTYYPTLAQSNVELVTEGLREITKTSICTADGLEYEVDLLIYATGFKTNPFLLGLDIQGENGISIKKHWKDSPKSYLGIVTNKFPNLFMLYGPNTNLGHNSIIIMAEAQANYIAQCVDTLKKNKWKSMEIKEAVIDAYYQELQDRLKQTIWAKVENSWYKSAAGTIQNNYPGRTMEYMRITKKVDFKHFTIH